MAQVAEHEGKKKQHRKKKKKKKKKERGEEGVKKTVQILVDYDLPSDKRRLDWDTDEVRRMVGEIG
jgi:hypothetical protein